MSLKIVLLVVSLIVSVLFIANIVKANDSFPNDENGNVLRQMQKRGDDLTKPRNIDFIVVLPNEENAEKLANHFQSLGYKTTIANSNTVKTLPWDVSVVKNMVPTHTDITNFEQELANIATSLGGRNDGWGSFVQ
ncbi:ribonuclease E inhibitor RraB [Methylotenera sp. 1P/1]|uniref:ribonuclease E inhibitor RraB n=1 Tax=Methylotenera sp. 1P/1 TaxID=1131551 RepID=UPI00037D483C|nr:ribonuclease E inhibitor RraB [Methylotenera sp. 1P/1]